MGKFNLREQETNINQAQYKLWEFESCTYRTKSWRTEVGAEILAVDQF